MRHTCPDGISSRLDRLGPIGTTVGVVFSCPRCGYSKNADAIERDSIDTLARYIGRVPEWRRRRLAESRGRIVAILDTTGSVAL